MPTENRSSNTDPRDVFIRLNPLGLGEAELRKDRTGFEDQRTHSDYLLFLAGYRESHPEPLQHTEQSQGGPASCIDAEPFFGLLEALREKIGYAIQFPVNCDAFKDGISKVWATIESLEKCIAIAAKQIHADPGEVDRLRAENEAFDAGMRNLACQLSAGGYNSESLTADQLLEKVQWGLTNLTEAQARLVDGLRAQRAERDALLTKMKALFRVDDPFDLYDAVCAVLSAKAEPSEPTPQAVNGHRLCCKAVDDYRPGKCSCGVEIDHEIPGTSFQRLNALANQGE
ncbi:hypothetical protein NPS42_14750 [Pseudomonas putida]|uniref:hypothetical protein n=1 Tax=Pseudomonas putida TaxID=303 RepID=UPI0023649971|nr:hypothetical protein [Pseudomonas putida]MDD2027050.1 hypothetical protein [Pseudomonas putida]HDS1765688.1 hypothetical protein [Pseudomonas putida]